MNNNNKHLNADQLKEIINYTGDSRFLYDLDQPGVRERLVACEKYMREHPETVAVMTIRNIRWQLVHLATREGKQHKPLSDRKMEWIYNMYM